ncbi:hypothetical protein CMI37_20355 [Candidatus Pacearchaeota archaeon]|nr:hypothetical protein [Candidatus Pacearchaeota archaeon]|tara:strand:+ start:2984 stop:3934 length:951 start_codon:yes stop_codon:yes gene_type:complete
MPTLSEYAKLANTDDLTAGIFENLITEDALIAMLQFHSFQGNSLAYNRENALPTTSTHAVGDTWQDTEATYSRNTASLAIVGNQSPLDRYALQTRSSVQNLEAVHIAGMTKSAARKFSQLIIQGEPEATTTEFEGLDSLCRSETRMMAMDDGVVDGPGAAETELTLDRFDAALDQIEGGKPDAVILNKTMRRKLTSLSRATGSGVLMDKIEMFGHQVATYDGIPLLIDDWITNSEQYNDASTWSSSTATTIFAVKFGQENQGYTIIHNGEVLAPDVQNIGIKENKNENLYRLVFYVQAITWSAKKIIALGGIDSAA